MLSTLSQMITSIVNFVDDNGERPPLQKTFEQIDPVLQYAYKNCSYYLKDKSIFDYGCGGGYGTEFLSRYTDKKVVGYDIDKYAIKTANIYYRHHKNISFTNQIPKSKFDVLVSFQVIEHLDQLQLKHYFQDIKNLVKPHGKIFISTVNKNITSYKLKTPVFAHHTYEFEPMELKKLLTKHFSQVNLFGQTDPETIRKVRNHEFSYKDTSCIPLKYRLIIAMSQIRPIRYITGKIPQPLKFFLLGIKNTNPLTYAKVADPTLIDNSYITIYECQR